MHARPTLNLIGAGHLGRTLARLWHEAGVFEIGTVLTRSLHSAREAVDFIGAGTPVSSMAEMESAAVWLIASKDGQIEALCTDLSTTGLLQHGDVVFHCSGALSSTALTAAAGAGAFTASVHPIKSFADPEHVAVHFAGTWCGAEGDAGALERLESAFVAIGARIAHIDTARKSTYHAAAVFASNYLVTVLDVALDVYVRAGVPRATAMQMMEPLVRGAVDNVFAMDTAAALSGPLARGDRGTAIRQYRALRSWDRKTARLYKALAKPTLVLARRSREPKT